jgi:uncharacterized protein (TIGR00369 family)
MAPGADGGREPVGPGRRNRGRSRPESSSLGTGKRLRKTSKGGQERKPEPHRLVKLVKTESVPIAKLIGFEMDEIEDGRAVGYLDAGPRHSNPMGTLHGVILCDLADAAMGMAFASTLKAHETFTTLELKVNFLRPVWSARLRAEGKVVSRGKKVGYVECTVTDERDRLVAKAVSTCLVLRGGQAVGR